MTNYWLIQYALEAVGWGYLILVLIALALALWLPKGKFAKTFVAVIVLGLASVLPIQGYQGYLVKKKETEEFLARRAKAQALFDKRCETAGEKIYRTVEGVEGIVLKGTRGTFGASNYTGPNWEGAGFPGESAGNQYIMEFLYYNIPAHGVYGRELGPKPGGLRGYRYVDVEEGGVTKRISLRKEAEYTLVGASDPIARYGRETPSGSSSARYAVTYEDIPDPEGRASWVAGGHLKVVDQRTGELLGEFIRYAFERGLGNTNGGRQPWAFAVECPLSTDGVRSGHIRSFVEQVIKPKQAE